MPTHLCNYCSQIDFGLLSLPTVSELAALNEGSLAVDRRDALKGSHGVRDWNLGPQSRIEAESVCRLCAAIRNVLHRAVASQPMVRHQWARAENNDLLCIATIDLGGTILPSEAILGDGSPPSVTIQHLSLKWVRPWDDDVCRSPGQIKVPREPGHEREVLGLYSCFQLKSQNLSMRDVVENTTPDPDAELFGGRLVPEFIDRRLPRQWLDDCLSNHGDTCGRSLSAIPRYVSCRRDYTRFGPTSCSADSRHEISKMDIFRLIDVQGARIVEFRQTDLRSLEYATLSYVWGGLQKNGLVRANTEELQAPGSLANLPKSIQDAICITKDLLIPFLWVDSFCIVQDSDEDKTEQISNMGSIYSCSTVTLVAATGRSAQAGLPGVTSPRKPAQMPIALNDSGLRASAELLTRLNPSIGPYSHPTEGTVWASRGWTFQEQELSTRLIYFLDGQILWSCASDHRSEEVHSETPIAKATWLQNQNQPHLFELRSEPSKMASVWNIDRTWKMIVLDFTNRSLSFPGDALDAVTGALQLLQSVTGRDFLWGLPRKEFQSNLHWSFLAQPSRRVSLTTLPSTSLNCRVPYPSWSWLGWEHFYLSWMPPAWDSSRPGEMHLITCFVLKNSPPRLELVEHEGRRDSEAVKTPSLDEVEVILQQWNKTAADIPDDQYLVFKTQRARFPAAKNIPGRMGVYLDIRMTHGPGQMVKTKILDSYGHPVGEYIAERIGELDFEEQVERDFVCLASEHIRGKGGKTVHVLEVEQKDGIWYRVDAADIDEKAWNEALVCEELVILG